MKTFIFFSKQIGVMFSWGTQFEGRRYICIEIPFICIQLLSAIPKKLNGETVSEAEARSERN
jgi:hypothetical protein